MILVQRLSQTDTDVFVNTVENALQLVFNCSKNDLPENYSESCEWGLLNLIKSNSLVDYYLLYVDGELWAGSGGIIRNFNNEKIYQAAFRGFSCAKFIHNGLGMKSLLHKWITKEQILDAQVKGCSSVIISFNDHNKRLFDVTHKYIMPRSLPEVEWEVSMNPVLFNYVPQWLLVHKLK